MSVASIPESLWRSNPSPPTWWGRGARFGYGMVVLAIGLAGETWATSRDDSMGLAISGGILVMASGILLAAVLSPTWPAIAKALESAQRAAAPLWSPAVAAFGKALSFATAAMAAITRRSLMFAELVLLTGRDILLMVVRHIAVACERVRSVTEPSISRSWRRISPVVGRALSRLARVVATVAARLVSVMSTTAVVAGRVLIACWHPVGVAGHAVTALTLSLVRGSGHVASLLSGGVSSTARLMAVPIRGLALVFVRLVRRADQVLRWIWAPTSSGLVRVLAWTGGRLATIWPPTVASSARVARTLRHVALVLCGPVASAAGRSFAWTRELLAAAWRSMASVITTFAAAVGGALARPAKWLSKELTPARLTLVIVELVFVGIAIHFSDVWAWWLDGERITAEVVEVKDPSIGPGTAVKLVDPYTDRVTTVWLGIGLGTIDEGDTTTAVLVPTDPSRGVTPALLAGLVALWTLLPAGALMWPVWWRRRWRHRLPRAWPRIAAAHPA